MTNYSDFTEEDWEEFDKNWNPDHLDAWAWKCLLMYKSHYATKCDWSIFNGLEWACLLAERPEFAEYCDWKKLDHFDWSWLLVFQPQFTSIYEKYKCIEVLKMD